ncbi:MAG: hypothetical protein V1688_00350 [bacterium]
MNFQLKLMSRDKQNQENLSKLGEVFANWSFPEYIKYEHSRRWYVWFCILMLGLLIFSLASLNFLFAVIIIIFAVVVFLHDTKEPMRVDFYIGEKGIFLGRKFFDYKELKTFWLIYEPKEVKNLYFCQKGFIKPLISIPLSDQNPLKIRDFLLQYLEEDLEKEEEPASEQFGRRFKI